MKHSSQFNNSFRETDRKVSTRKQDYLFIAFAFLCIGALYLLEYKGAFHS